MGKSFFLREIGQGNVPGIARFQSHIQRVITRPFREVLVVKDPAAETSGFVNINVPHPGVRQAEAGLDIPPKKV
jgi:hypothetical protein